ncbi:hypothetical protein [Deinococcus ruber]|uniref:Uncharacterized protein n=1 Tax=Deinococcus ruber TaxID=1848197 RepID=A0A918CD83_9DEIO|nr:hypothetical protein [Deinococcus ruber]GGR16778.1 hypothetical protein GCM10008957_31770 [Deinococcus ruber]
MRALYQHICDHANLPNLEPRPLLAAQIKPGASEFGISGVVTAQGGGMGAAGLVVRRTYSGFVAVHYDPGTNSAALMPDEAALNAALEGFRLTEAYRTPGVVAFGGFAIDFKLNEFPEKVGLAPTMSMFADFELTLDLETGVTYV